MKTVFERKPDFHFRDFVIEKAVTIPAAQFEQMLRKPLSDQKFLVENAGLMRQDGMDVYHCLLVTGEGRLDGLLVESEGCSYARYASYVPEATALRYASLAKMNQELAAAVDFIIADGTGQTSEGNWILSFAELENKTGLCVTDKPFLQELLGDMLCERPEVADLSIGDDCFDVDYYLDFCPNYQAEQSEEMPAAQTLRDLLQTPMEDVHLLHTDVEIEPATIVELSERTLTDAGKQAWADVLGAKVCEVYQGFYGLQVDLDGVKPSRLRDFSMMLAGYCSEENYEKWVAQSENTPAPSPEMKL